MAFKFRSPSLQLPGLVAMLVLACALPALTQVHGSLSGRVEDPSGSPVTDATITIKSLETGATRIVTTNPEGQFHAAPLPLGQQEVRVEKVGFKATVRNGVDLKVGQDAVVNIKLEVGDVAQAVTVSEEASLVNTTTSSVSGLVSEREVKELPLNGRSFDNLIALNPSSINYALKSANTSTSNGSTFAVAGRRPGDSIFLLNGVEYMGSSQLAVTPGGASQQLLGIDAIREFNVLTDTYPAEYGKRAGGQVVVVTQSGTNALHGTVFEFLRNSDLDARNFFDQAAVPPFRRNQFGGSLGGPIQKRKLFLFGNYEGFRQSLAVSSVSVVPDQATRKSATANPAIVPYFALWPLPNGVALGGGIATSYNNPRQSIREDFGTARADYILRDRDTLSTAYTIDDGTNLSPQADPLFGSLLTLRNQVASIQEVHVFSPSVVNVFTTGYSRSAFNFDPTNYTSFPSNLSFVTGAGPGGIVIGGGTTTSGGSTVLTSAGPNNAANVWNRRNLFTESDDLRITKGIHQIAIGVWLQRLRDNEDTASRQLGQSTFTSLATFLAGNVSSFQVVPNPNELGWRSLYGAWYVQDAMKLRPNLTLSMGLRYEASNGWNEVSGRAANYIPDSTGVLQTVPVVGNSAFTKNSATHLLGPRLGLAYDPSGHGKTSIRAGFGTYYSLIDALSYLLNSLPPANGAVSYSNVSLASILPITRSLQPAPSCRPGIAQPCTIFAPQGVQADAKTPTVEEWNLSVEQELSSNLSLRVAYVGSHGYHGFLSVDPNDIPAQTCNNSAGCTAGGTPGTTKSTVPNGAQYIPVGSRPNPYLGAGFFWYTEGNSSYNALQIDIKKRLSHGLQFRANYTWSKDLDMNSGLTGAQSNNQAQMILDRNDPRRDWGPSALNAAHQASLSGSYALPFFHKSRYAGGWQVNAIATLLSGFPFTPQLGSNRSGDGDTRNPDRPSLNPAFTGPVILGAPTGWFNPNAFILPAAGTYGNLGRSTFYGPTLADLDASLFKTFAVTERASLQFRAEFFNLLNHPNFGTPNATVFSGTTYSPSAGIITSTATTSRQIQFGLKLIF
jgi:hypothetical protein